MIVSVTARNAGLAAVDTLVAWSFRRTKAWPAGAIIVAMSVSSASRLHVVNDPLHCQPAWSPHASVTTTRICNGCMTERLPSAEVSDLSAGSAAE